MKILEILVKESFGFGGEQESRAFSAPNISLSDLNSLQLRTLERLRDGVVDLETASEKELNVIMDLIDMGLVDADGNVTASGDEATAEPTTNVKYDDEDEEQLDIETDLDDLDDSDDNDIDFNLNRNKSSDY